MILPGATEHLSESVKIVPWSNHRMALPGAARPWVVGAIICRELPMVTAALRPSSQKALSV